MAELMDGRIPVEEVGEVDADLQGVLTGHLAVAYKKFSENTGTPDVVLLVDLAEPGKVFGNTRESILGSALLGFSSRDAALREVLSEPANIPGMPGDAFWLMVIRRDGEMVVLRLSLEILPMGKFSKGAQA